MDLGNAPAARPSKHIRLSLKQISMQLKHHRMYGCYRRKSHTRAELGDVFLVMRQTCLKILTAPYAESNDPGLNYTELRQSLDFS
jgi:hypothetical protein